MPAPSIPGGWTDTADKQLLLAVLASHGITTAKWNEVVAIMGNGVTVSAASQRLGAIRKSVGASGGGGQGPKTPSKKGIAKKTGSTGKRKATKGHDVDEGGDDDEEERTPVKKVKKEIVKMQEDDDDDGLI